MNGLFSRRIGKIHRSFVTEILSVTENPEVISFAGGIPNSTLFPIQEVAEAAARVLREEGQVVLQYTTTQGYLPLRQYIADRYRQKHGLEADPADILITNGSQQGFDLIGKVFLERGDRVVLERPTYHGALQGFSLYETDFVQVPLLEDGPDVDALSRVLEEAPAKLFYSVPSFQNPSGLTYSLRKRKQVADLLAGHRTVHVEDDPYSELRFGGHDLPPIKKFLPESTVLLGTFSKTVAPAFRLGWAWSRHDTTRMLIEAKQAADFHSDYFAQRVLHRYLADNDLDEHIAILRAAYKKQCDFMLSVMARYLPEEAHYTRPEGGMFVYVTLPEGVSTLRLFEIAARSNVAFVPGVAFHAGGRNGDNAMRLSFSTSDEARTEEGMKRLGTALRELLGESARGR